jgi:hypothetical protein
MSVPKQQIQTEVIQNKCLSNAAEDNLSGSLTLEVSKQRNCFFNHPFLNHATVITEE